MLHLKNIEKTRRPLQITVCTLHKLLREVFEIHMILEDKNTDFDLCCTENVMNSKPLSIGICLKGLSSYNTLC